MFNRIKANWFFKNFCFRFRYRIEFSTKNASIGAKPTDFRRTSDPTRPPYAKCWQFIEVVFTNVSNSDSLMMRSSFEDEINKISRNNLTNTKTSSKNTVHTHISIIDWISCRLSTSNLIKLSILKKMRLQDDYTFLFFDKASDSAPESTPKGAEPMALYYERRFPEAPVRKVGRPIKKLASSQIALVAIQNNISDSLTNNMLNAVIQIIITQNFELKL